MGAQGNGLRFVKGENDLNFRCAEFEDPMGHMSRDNWSDLMVRIRSSRGWSPRCRSGCHKCVHVSWGLEGKALIPWGTVGTRASPRTCAACLSPRRKAQEPSSNLREVCDKTRKKD